MYKIGVVGKSEKGEERFSRGQEGRVEILHVLVGYSLAFWKKIATFVTKILEIMI